MKARVGISIVSGRPPSPSCIQGRRDQDEAAISQPTPLAGHAPFRSSSDAEPGGLVRAIRQPCAPLSTRGRVTPARARFLVIHESGDRRTTRPRACFTIGSPHSYPPRLTNGLGPAGASPSEELPRHRHSARQRVDAAVLALVELLPCRA